MTNSEYLRARGWLPVIILADGTVLLWDESLSAQASHGGRRKHGSTAEAIAIQVHREPVCGALVEAGLGLTRSGHGIITGLRHGKP